MRAGGHRQHHESRPGAEFRPFETQDVGNRGRAYTGGIDHCCDVACPRAELAGQLADEDVHVASEHDLAAAQHFTARVGECAKHALRAERLREQFVFRRPVLNRERGADFGVAQILERLRRCGRLHRDDQHLGAAQTGCLAQRVYRGRELHQPSDT